METYQAVACEDCKLLTVYWHAADVQAVVHDKIAVRRRRTFEAYVMHNVPHPSRPVLAVQPYHSGSRHHPV